jgi:uncharacterized protein YjbJ (UPF0337 family)
MVNQQVLAGKWNEISGKLKEKWGELIDDDLRAFNGNVDQLVGTIQRKTGESRAAIEGFLGEIAEGSSQAASHLRDKAQEGATQFAQAAREGYDALRQGYAEAESMVQQRPGQSLAVAFGLGLLAGVGVALLLRQRRSETESAMSRSRAAAEHFGRHVLDTLASMMPQRP